MSYADMVTLLMCLFIVLFAMSQVDKAKFAALASGLVGELRRPDHRADRGATARRLGARRPARRRSTSPPAIASPDSQGRRRQQVDAAAAQAAPSGPSGSPAEAQAAYDQLAAARDRIAGRAGRRRLRRRGELRDRRARPGRAHRRRRRAVRRRAAPTCGPRARPMLDAVAPTLTGLPNQLRVEGHANRLPVTPGGPWPSNWELSALPGDDRRSATWPATGCPSAGCRPTGYCRHRPLVPDTDPSAITVNRRVDIVVLSTASAEANALLPGTRRRQRSTRRQRHEPPEDQEPEADGGRPRRRAARRSCC